MTTPPAAASAATSDSRDIRGWRFDHINVSVGGAVALRALFEDVMQLKPGPRPPFPFPGVWLYQNNQALIHAVDDPLLSARGGELRLGHVAFRGDEPASGVIERLRRGGLPFKVAQLPGEAGCAQIFVLLPGGLIVELDLPNDTMADHRYEATRAAPGVGDFQPLP